MTTRPSPSSSTSAKPRASCSRLANRNRTSGLPSRDCSDRLGPALGRGAVWMQEPVKAAAWSEPYLFAGYDRRGVHLSHSATSPVTFEFEVDARRPRNLDQAAQRHGPGGRLRLGGIPARRPG